LHRAPRALGLATLLAAAYLALALASPEAIGIWQDDGIYVSTAKALAEGRGYRHLELPGEPLQTKYPVLYPAVLSLAFRLDPSFPSNRALLHVPTALAAAALVLLAARYLEGVLGAGRRLALAAAALAAASPAVLAFARYAMSELPYAALAAGALLCLDLCLPRAGSPRAARGWAAAGGLLIGAALLTRSIGITLAIAAPLALALRRRWLPAAIVAAVPLACWSPWLWWRAGAAAQNGPVQQGFFEAPDLDYALWIPDAAGEILRVAWQNGFRAAFSLGYEQLGLPVGFANAAISGLSWRTPLLHAACAAALVLVVAGFVASLRRRPSTLHLYAALYAGAVGVWPFSPGRFLVPWTPFLLYFLLEGAGCTGRAAAARLGGDPVRSGRLARATAVAVLAVSFAAEAARLLGSTPERYFLREVPQGLDLLEEREAFRWLVRHSGPRDVVASLTPARVFLHTGRRGQVLWPDTDPYARYYGPDRTWESLYVNAARSEVEVVAADMQRDLLPSYREAGIDLALVHDRSLEAAVFRRLAEASPAVLPLRFASADASVRVYGVRAPPPSGGPR
jgi:4-amino-4-deoxy-L-arabinose transferase-like glycosyltransferase